MDPAVYQSVIKPLLVEDSLPVINWMMQQGLLKRELKCSHCHVAMTWTKRSASQDKYAWKCQVKDCKKYKQYESIRKDSFFSHSKLSLQKWVETIYLWCEETNVTQAVDFLNISKVTLIDIYHLFRELCTNYFVMNPIKLGGPGLSVQIDDESFFSHKTKNRKGDTPSKPIRLFGIVDTSTTPSIGYMEIVESRDPITLFPIIRKVVLPHTIVYSDEWRAYRSIEKEQGLAHQTVSYSLNFVDKTTGVLTQATESYWNKIESHIKKMRGCKRAMLNSYLQEYMWRERNSSNTFIALCSVIADQFKLE